MIAAFDFATAGCLRFGRGTAEEAAGIAAGLGRRVLVLRSASVAAADRIADQLRREGVAVTTRISRGEPDLPGILASLEEARGVAPDLILAIGGGAVIDHGKALAALLPAPHGPMRHLEVVGEGRPLDAEPLPLIAVPTTAGTGAEVTRNAVIGIPGATPNAGRKVSLRDARMLPRVALVDPALTDSCPRPVTLASGLDALTQVIEAYACTRANPMTDALCRMVLPMGLPALARLMRTQDRTQDAGARDAMALTSVAGGIALANAGLGAVHGLAGVIGGRTGAAHGAICGALLVPVLRANLAAAPAGSAAEARLRWVTGAIAQDFGSLEDFAAWTRDMGLPGLSQLGVDAALHADIASAARASSSFKANPAPLDDAALIAALAAAG